MTKHRDEKITIAGPAGSIAARLARADDDRGDYIAIVCHPHPLHGGSMDNKVVYYTARALREVGMAVLRFNFRGVGASEGEFDNAIGEQQDLAAVAAWAAAHYPHRALLLAGFSFGAYVAAAKAQDLAARRLLSIAPPIHKYDFDGLHITMPWLVIMGDADEVVPVVAVRQWLRTAAAQREVVWMKGAGHFFHGQLPQLAAHIKQWLG